MSVDSASVKSRRRDSALGTILSAPARHCSPMSYSPRGSAHLWSLELILRLRNSQVKVEQSVTELERRLARN